jgi:hypothetical protein
MTTKHKQTLYMLLAFLILALLHFTVAIVNMVIENDLLARVIDSSGLVINVTGVIIGIYDIYRGLTLRKHTNFWSLIFIVGILCAWVNAWALLL